MDSDHLIRNFKALIESGKDGPMARFGLGKAYLDGGDPAAAARELERAVAMNPAWSAAWKMLGKARGQASDRAGAALAWKQGIEAATAKGDRQASKEMEVFLRRIEREIASSNS
ncbi:tetratricopeptide repeat protein [Thioalkalivibrio sp. HK1]|uniref:tetratricopeptide repeat protein n=1 Tax=Thioalkalivibrio sp. HK1 TaxID=1469245 RepID=UPI0004BAA6AE|nr:tetratricopeptide repeat protein [Thioalkalivibrio sp. HK1]